MSAKPHSKQTTHISPKTSSEKVNELDRSKEDVIMEIINSHKQAYKQKVFAGMDKNPQSN